MTNYPRVVLYTDGTELPLTLGELGDDAPSADCACPGCSAPLRVLGSGREIGGHDYYRAKGFCASCRAYVGEIRAYVDTIFGLEEDERVLHGRPRVY